MPSAKMKRSSAIFRRPSMAAHTLRTDVSQRELSVAPLQRKDVGRLSHPPLHEKEFKLLLAEPLDIEGATRSEQLQVLDLLIGTGELAGAAGAGGVRCGGRC